MNDYPPNNLTIQIDTPAANYQVVRFLGSMDKAGLTEVRTKLDSIVEQFALAALVFDLTALDYINSESIGFLMSVHSHLKKLDRRLVLINAKANVKDIFQVIGLLTVVEYYDSLPFFLAKLGS